MRKYFLFIKTIQTQIIWHTLFYMYHCFIVALGHWTLVWYIQEFHLSSKQEIKWKNVWRYFCYLLITLIHYRSIFGLKCRLHHLWKINKKWEFFYTVKLVSVIPLFIILHKLIIGKLSFSLLKYFDKTLCRSFRLWSDRSTECQQSGFGMSDNEQFSLLTSCVVA